jgi:xylulose-5-phosphate/fructose-6-phosphate phosphoketolase
MAWADRLLNYIETSTLWRQEHNGHSHQNPGLIGSFLGLPRHCARIYLPAEANSSVSVMAHCLRSATKPSNGYLDRVTSG